ncbi:acetylxylan esterase [candidate division KSB1 bacterium]|nr:acetylxylan esterase [candidate division KSB1 bacterium]RQW06042.1 MAG: acetylxylan esterase [candidate division KSB1 bacterium]
MMKKSPIWLSLGLLFGLQVFAQWSPEERERINRLNQEDHQYMLKELGIAELRPGPSGNPEAPDAANTDEAKATPYTSLPDPLVFNDGTPVLTAEQWEKRKQEIYEEFDREMYGRIPEKTPAVVWEVMSEKDTLNGDYPITRKQLVGHVDNSAYPAITVDIQMTLTVPQTVADPVPVVIEFGWNFPMSWMRRGQEGPTWQQRLLEKGWGYAILVPTSIQADNGAGLSEGIIGLVNKGQRRKLDDWGALRAWAWGASRAMDYLEADPEVDAGRVVIEGLSRYGKAALVTLAYEPRIAIGLIGSSGAGGAKILRRVLGEQVENLAASGEYHWFAPNFIKYAGPLTALDLPVDAHELIALCAPRPVFISVGSPDVEGQWVDAKGMFLAGVHAGPVYELLGARGLGVTEFPAQETALVDGEIAFRQHAGGHTVEPNWPVFLEYAERYFAK